MALFPRATVRERLAGGAFDLLVIGGGITGAGVARDAALRGLAVALVDAGDWAGGTSSRSSRLVHGGIRYLEHGWLGLVHEAAHERHTLLTQAPRLVRPLPFIWPVYRGDRVPRWKLRAGLFLYDRLAGSKRTTPHRALSREGLLALEPALRSAQLVGGAQYHDAQTGDAALTLATVRDAAALGAACLNHAAVTALVRADGRIGGAVVRETLDDEPAWEAVVRARVVVNAAGPWSDAVRRLDDPATPSGVRGTKGVHLMLPRQTVGNRGALTVTAPQDGRVMFVLPWGTHTLVGTTDTFDDAPPSDVRADEGDVTYLLDAVRHYFPQATATRRDVLSAWAGLRPLVASATSRAPAASSREHELVRAPSGLLSITGGKLTTYRAMAAQVVDAVEAALSRPRTPCRTDRRPLPDADDQAPWALDDVANGPADRLRAVVHRAVHVDGAATVGDVLLRRVAVAFERADHARELAAPVAALMAAELGWSPERQTAEVSRYAAEAARLFTIDAAPAR